MAVIDKPGFYFVQQPNKPLTVVEAFGHDRLMLRVLGDNALTQQQWLETNRISSASAVALIAGPHDRVEIAPDGMLYINGARVPSLDDEASRAQQLANIEMLLERRRATVSAAELLEAVRYPFLFSLHPEPPHEPQQASDVRRTGAAEDATGDEYETR